MDSIENAGMVSVGKTDTVQLNVAANRRWEINGVWPFRHAGRLFDHFQDAADICAETVQLGINVDGRAQRIEQSAYVTVKGNDTANRQGARSEERRVGKE